MLVLLAGQLSRRPSILSPAGENDLPAAGELVQSLAVHVGLSRTRLQRGGQRRGTGDRPRHVCRRQPLVATAANDTFTYSPAWMRAPMGHLTQARFRPIRRELTAASTRSSGAECWQSADFAPAWGRDRTKPRIRLGVLARLPSRHSASGSAPARSTHRRMGHDQLRPAIVPRGGRDGFCGVCVFGYSVWATGLTPGGWCLRGFPFELVCGPCLGCPWLGEPGGWRCIAYLVGERARRSGAGAYAPAPGL